MKAPYSAMMLTLAVGAACVLVLTRGALPQEDNRPDGETKKAAKPKGEPAKDGPAVPKPPTHRVERKPFRVELTVKGILEPEEVAEVAYQPQPIVGLSINPGPLTVRQVVEHGTKVRAGDQLLAMDTRRIDQVITQLETDEKDLDANIKVAEEELPLLEKSVPVDLLAAERAKQHADEDLGYFLKTARPESEKQAQFSVKSAAFWVESAKEELRQLEKMYKANDLTEDTEEIVLKRQRHWLEMSTYYLKRTEIQRDYVLKVDLPRRELSLREDLVKQSFAWDKARTTLVPQLKQKQQALVKLRHDKAKLHNGLEMLRRDREAMTIMSPAEGVVYYGKFARGQWENAASMAGRLVPNGTVPAEEVLMTVVKGKPGRLRISLDEKDLHLVKAGLQGKAEMAFDPDRKVPARVTKVSPVPAAPGKFEANVALDLGADAADLVPGMACSVRFVPYANKTALALPSRLILEEEDKHFVYMAGKDGKSEKREVTPGKSHGGRTEVLRGLREGEEVLLEPPDESKKSAATEKGTGK